MRYRGFGPQSARSERRDELRRMQAEQRKRARPDYLAWLETLEKPSEIAARHERDNDDDQAKMERGECCGRCSSSGMCGSGRWGWLWYHLRTRDCPYSDHAIMRELLPTDDWSIIWETLDKVNEMSNGLKEHKAGSFAEVGERLEKCRGLIAASESDLERALLTAQGVALARKFVSDNIEKIAPLADTELGFLTDRANGKKQPYSNAELVVAITTALIKGLPLTGNCFNIFNGRCYTTTEGYDHQFGHRDGCDFPDVRIGNIEITTEPAWVKGRDGKDRPIPGTARVEAWGSVTADGVRHQVAYLNNANMDERLHIKYNSGMAEDAIAGKAACRVKKALWSRVTNSAFDDPDEPYDATIIDAPSVPLPTTSDPNEGGIDPLTLAKDQYRADLDKAEADSSLLGAGIAFDRFVSACGNLWSPDLDSWAVAEREAVIKIIHELRRNAT